MSERYITESEPDVRPEPAAVLHETSFHENDPLRDYFNEIGKTPLLKAEEEVELAQRIEAGLYAEALLGQRQDDEIAVPVLDAHEIEELEALAAQGREAKDHLIRANLRLVVSIAKRYRSDAVSPLEIIQEGNVGLIRGVEKFDYTKGYKFSTYGTWWIRQAITRSLAQLGRNIRLPVHTYETVNSLRRIEREMTTLLGYEPTNEELAEELGIDAQKVADIKHYGQDTISLHTKVGGDEDAELIDFLADIEMADEDNKELVRLINEVVSTLPEREARIVRMRYGLDGNEPKILKVIGAELGITAERVRQIDGIAKRKIKEALARHHSPELTEILQRIGKNRAA